MKKNLLRFIAATSIICMVMSAATPVHAQQKSGTATATSATAPETIPQPPPPPVESSWIWEIFSWGMWPLWVCSFLLAALIYDRYRSLNAKRIVDHQMFEQVTDYFATLDIQSALESAQKSDTVAGRAWAKGIHEFSMGGVALQDALTHASLLALKPMKKGFQAIATIATISPLFGLLGTIVGMILAFSNISATGGADKSQLAGAISLALFTTAGGLLVAIPAIIAGRYFNSKLIAFTEQIETAIHEVNYQYSHALAKHNASGGKGST